jgi:hypothetical protein
MSCQAQVPTRFSSLPHLPPAADPTAFVDFDVRTSFIVASSVWTVSYTTATTSPQAFGGLYSGDNINTGVNNEAIRWPPGSSPPRTTYYVCVDWYDNFGPVNVTVAVQAGGGTPVRASKSVNTALPCDRACRPGSNQVVAVVIYG